MANAIKPRRYSAYGYVGPTKNLFPDPVVVQRDPLGTDLGYEIGILWVNSLSDEAFILTSIKAGVANWESVNAATTGTFGSLTVTAGPTTLNYAAAENGVLVTDATGVVTASQGQDGQVLIGSTGAAPEWHTLTAGTGISISEGPGAVITISGAGGSGLTWSTPVGSQTAAVNRGYRLTGAYTITLPASPALGDVVAIAQDAAAGTIITLKAGATDVIYLNGVASPGGGGFKSTAFTAVGTGPIDQVGCYLEVVALSASAWTVRSSNGEFIATT